MRRRKRAIPRATAAQQAYQDSARELGCVVCHYRIARGLQRAGQPGATHIHHRNLGDLHGQKQLGQDKVVAMCAWHHEGDQLPGKSRDEMREIYGPSFKHHARDFRVWTADVFPPVYGFGTEAWQTYQNHLLSRKEAA